MSATLDHVALTVTDREVSAAFYARHFGFSHAVHDDDYLLILAGEGGGLLALSAGSVPPVPPRTTHFGFRLADAAAVHRLRDAFQKAGVAGLEWQPSGPVRVQVADPDGYRVEAYAFD